MITWHGVWTTYWILWAYFTIRSLWIKHILLDHWLKQASSGELDSFWLERRRRGLTPLHAPLDYWTAVTSFWKWRIDYRHWH